MIALDTHVVVWLYQDGAAAVTDVVAARLEEEQVRIAPPVLLEMAYLREIGRLTVQPSTIVDYLSARLDVGREDISADALFKAAMPMDWTRDPFDRLICAHASVLGIDLVTKDVHIRDHHDATIW